MDALGATVVRKGVRIMDILGPEISGGKVWGFADLGERPFLVWGQFRGCLWEYNINITPSPHWYWEKEGQNSPNPLRSFKIRPLAQRRNRRKPLKKMSIFPLAIHDLGKPI